MLQSDQQLRNTLVWARRFKMRAQALCDDSLHPVLLKACKDGMLSMADDLEQQAEEYLQQFIDEKK